MAGTTLALATDVVPRALSRRAESAAPALRDVSRDGLRRGLRAAIPTAIERPRAGPSAHLHHVIDAETRGHCMSRGRAHVRKTGPVPS